MPATNRAYWQRKIGRNIARDAATLQALSELGWTGRVIWECETKDAPALSKRIARLVGKLPASRKP